MRAKHQHLVRRLIAHGILLTLALLGSTHAAAEWFSDQQAIMGTSVSVTLEALESRLLARIRLIAFSGSNALRTVVNYSFEFLPY